MYKCVIWGTGIGYESILNQILFEIHKGNISVEAIVCCKEEKYCGERDGIRLITPDEIKMPFDYLVIADKDKFNEIKKHVLALGIEEKRILDGQKFLLPLFDFSRYVQLIEEPVTILSDDCWGGYAYNRLGLTFSSPLINIYWDREQYSKFILDPLFYLDTELTMVREGDLRKGIYPLGQLGNGEKSVQLEFVHNVDFAEAKEQWDRRKKRINRKNLFVKMGFNASEEKKDIFIDAFKKVDCKKILFYNGDETVAGAFKTERFMWRQTSGKRVETTNYNDFVRMSYYWELDLLKLLTGEKDYSREK